MTIMQQPDTPPSVRIYWNAAKDAQSGIYEYQYRIVSARDSRIQSENWTPVGNVLEKTISGDILRYLDTFYVYIQAVNFAGAPSEPTRFGPFRPADPTPPTKPNVAVSYGVPAGTTYLIFSEHSRDNETFIKGYQIAIGTTPGGTNRKGWYDSIDFKPTEIRTANSYRLANYGLTDGTYYISVRARNYDGLTSAPCVTGPYYVDSSPPIRPTVTPTLSTSSGVTRINLSFSNISDPQSGVAKTEYCMGSASGSANLRNWTVLNYSVTTAYPPSIVLTSAENVPGRTYYIGVRTTNTVGLVSETFWTSITIPIQMTQVTGTTINVIR